MSRSLHKLTHDSIMEEEISHLWIYILLVPNGQIYFAKGLGYEEGEYLFPIKGTQGDWLSYTNLKLREVNSILVEVKLLAKINVSGSKVIFFTDSSAPL